MPHLYHIKDENDYRKEVAPYGISPSQSFVEGDNWPALKRSFLILRFLILESSVEGGIPSATAAPDGPAIRPLLFANTSSMISLSRFCNLVDRDFAEVLSRGGRLISQLSSTLKTSPSHTITDRSTTFCSSRMLPGQL